MYTIGGRVKGEGVRPLSDERLDETLGLTVGARPVGPCSSVLDSEGAAGFGEYLRHVAGTIVSEDLFGLDPTGSKPSYGTSKECARCGPFLVLEDFHIRQSRSIIDAHVDVLPANPSSPLGLVTRDPVADSTYLAEFLDVQV